jgi:hypothetical protein
LEKRTQALKLPVAAALLGAAELAGVTVWADGGVMRGTGATPRSGRIRVFARFTVPVGGFLVGIGTSRGS